LEQEHASIENRIKSTAESTDKLITRLDTLTNRIDTARSNENRELVEYYERQFAEASVEFLDGVETILDGWYALRGEERPPAAEEYISPDMIDSIHNTVVSIIQGQPADLTEPASEPGEREISDASGRAGVNPAAGADNTAFAAPAAKGPRHKVDVTG
jgi:hypothetical protein